MLPRTVLVVTVCALATALPIPADVSSILAVVNQDVQESSISSLPLFQIFKPIIDMFPNFSEVGPKVEVGEKYTNIIVKAKDYKIEDLIVRIKGKLVVLQGSRQSEAGDRDLTSEFLFTTSLPNNINSNDVFAKYYIDGYLVVTSPNEGKKGFYEDRKVPIVLTNELYIKPKPLKPVENVNVKPLAPVEPVKPVAPVALGDNEVPEESLAPVKPVAPVASDVPAVPEESVAPIKPVAPVASDVSEVPVDTVVPVKPVEPEDSNVPVVPEESVAPVKPVDPVASDVPVVPVEAVAPVKQVETVASNVLVVPEESVAPVKPVEPVAADVPVVPVEPVVPVKPVLPVASEEPKVQQVASLQPVEPVEPVVPVVPETPVAPVSPVVPEPAVTPGIEPEDEIRGTLDYIPGTTQLERETTAQPVVQESTEVVKEEVNEGEKKEESTTPYIAEVHVETTTLAYNEISDLEPVSEKN